MQTHATTRPWAALLLSLAAVATQASAPLTQWTVLRRSGLAEGELWRAITGHWTHWSLDHLGWNLLAFGVTGALLEWRGQRRLFLVATGLSALAIAASIWAWRPGLAEYRGLSGIASALFALLAAELLRDALRAGRRGLATLLATLWIAYVAKLSIEVATGHAFFVDAARAGFVTVPLAHVVGSGVGLVLAWHSGSLAGS